MSDAVLERKMLPTERRRELPPWSRFEWETDEGEREKPSASADLRGEALLEKITQRVDISARPRYGKTLLAVFVTSLVATIAALAGLLASPFFASSDIVTALFAVAGIGMGVLAVVVHKAERVRQS